MSFYNMLFGMNPQSDLLLAVIGLRKNDVERFRDVHASEDGAVITVHSRTGGGNRDDYPNLIMRKRPEWSGSSDDDYDSTYCDDTFKVSPEWVDDVLKLQDLFGNGLRAEFGQHLIKTLRREPTDDDKATALYDQESSALKGLNHFMANGHTFVPKDDSAMESALKLAEANDGKLRSCWGIAPLVLTVKRDFYPYPNAKPPINEQFIRVEVNYDFKWNMDIPYWEHCQKRFAAIYPKSMAKIRETVATFIAKQAA